MKIIKTLTAITLIAVGANANAYTPTFPTAIFGPSDGSGFTVPATNGTCSPDRTLLTASGLCAFNVPEDENACPDGAFTIDGAGCMVQPSTGDIVELGIAGTDMSDPSKWIDFNTGNSPTSDVVAQVQAIVGNSNNGTGGGTTGGGTSTGNQAIQIDLLSIIEGMLGLQQGNTVGAIGASIGIVLGFIAVEFGARKIKKILGIKGGKGISPKGKGTGGKTKPFVQRARQVKMGNSSYTMYKGRNGRYSRGPAIGRSGGSGGGRRRRR
jgi:hypothetical protein